MSTAAAVLVDSREPEWVKNLVFGNADKFVMQLDSGDIDLVTTTGHRLVIERKTPDDFLGSLKDERLMVQIARLSELRNETTWSYLVITGKFDHDQNGRVITERGVTGWNYDAVQGALLTIQELGVFVLFCQGDQDFEDCIMRLASRSRKPVMNILPARVPNVLGPGAGLLAALPGIGSEKVMEILRWAGNIPAHALCGLTDLEIKAPLADNYRKKIRSVLGLQDREILDVWSNERGDMTMKVLEKVLEAETNKS